MLYETAARAAEILALNIEDLELDARRAKVGSKGGNTEYVYWSTGTARLPPRLIRGRTRGPVFISDRRPGPGRRPAARDLCPTTGRARLGYDRARILANSYTGWGPALTTPQRRHPPRRPRRTTATDHGQDAAPQPTYRDVLRQTRRRGRRRGHRTARHRPSPARLDSHRGESRRPQRGAAVPNAADGPQSAAAAHPSADTGRPASSQIRPALSRNAFSSPSSPPATGVVEPGTRVASAAKAFLLNGSATRRPGAAPVLYPSTRIGKHYSPPADG
jgi:hypothetical protein